MHKGLFCLVFHNKLVYLSQRKAAVLVSSRDFQASSETFCPVPGLKKTFFIRDTVAVVRL